MINNQMLSLFCYKLYLGKRLNNRITELNQSIFIYDIHTFTFNNSNF